MTTQATAMTNPYVGPRTFTYGQRHLFFGREREARDLLARMLSERLLLFYAQSGAGKSSLLHTRLIPQLQEEKGFVVLPVARVSGELLASVAQVDNIYTFNLMLSIDEGEDPARLAQITLTDFFARLTHRTIVDKNGAEHRGWIYDATQVPAPATASPNTRRYALIVDQFEEIITASPERWRERAGFFRQIDQAMRSDPNLWVVFTLREDYVASLDPYAPLLADRLRARFYMERMGVEAALAAIKQPAVLAGHPFAEGVAPALVDNLRRIKVIGQTEEQLGQYVEPVQLQVVCYQLWEKVIAAGIDVSSEITRSDLEKSGDVDTALADFYEQAIVTALAIPGANLSERQLRTWFDEQLITAAGTRGTIYRSPEETAGLSNQIVDALHARFLLRSELRAGGTWVELVHDRFVEPIRRANSTWRAAYYNPVAAACERWIESGRIDARLLRSDHLYDAITFASKNLIDITDEERTFLQRSQMIAKQRIRQRRLLISGAVALLLLFAGLAWYGLDRANAARHAQAKAEASANLANQQLARLEGLNLLQQAEQLSAVGKIEEAMTAYKKAVAFDSTLGIDLDAVTKKVYRQAAFLQVQEGERLAAQGKVIEAAAKFSAALKLNPPPSTPLYLWIPPGNFRMGSIDSDLVATDVEKPQHDVFLSGFWIMATEVTNLQYRSCVNQGVCEPPANNRYLKPQLDDWPVTNVPWNQALTYAKWVGGRLPTEAEWEKACRGTDARIYPWGNKPPSPQLLNYGESDGIWTTVGNYPKGQSFYGLMDMAGSVMEWTSTLWGSGEDALWTPDFFYPYEPDDGREATDAPADVYRVVRNGTFDNSDAGVFRCAFRQGLPPSILDIRIGFRVVSAAAPP